jgi:hypothetical protein
MTGTMKDEASYTCDSCGEEVVVPVDVSAGTSQEYVEDCPLCCHPNVIHVQVEEDEVTWGLSVSSQRQIGPRRV